MITIENDQFAVVCYLALMQNGEGLLDKAPSYIEEKQMILGRGVDAFAALDMHNMRLVAEWCKTWGVEMPTEAAEYYAESEAAANELQLRGFEI